MYSSSEHFEGAFLGSGDRAVGMQDKNSCSHGVAIQVQGDKKLAR